MKNTLCLFTDIHPNDAVFQYIFFLFFQLKTF